MGTFAERFVKIYEESGKSQSEFARTIKISEKTYRNYRDGATLPSYEALCEITKRYGVDANWLLIGEGQIYRDLEPGPKASSVADTNVNILSYQSKGNTSQQSQDVSRLLAQIESLQESVRTLTASNQQLIRRLLSTPGALPIL